MPRPVLPAALPFNEALFWKAHTGSFPASLHIAPVLDSTNAWLLASAAGLDLPALCLADRQTAGRGTWGRSWVTPESLDLTFSVLLKRPSGLSAPWLTLLAMDSWRQVIHLETGLPVGLKWPNDIYVSGRKLGGVLTETARNAAPDAVVVGMGINVNAAVFDAPLAATATSLFLCTGRVLDRETLLATWCRTFEQALDSPGPACAVLSRHFIHVNQWVTWQGGRGRFTGISANACPIVETASGDLHELTDPTIRFQHD